MIALLGTSSGVYFVFAVLFLVLILFAAYMTGQALALTWKPAWQGVAYCLILGLGDRFLTFALFEGELLSVTGYLVDTGVLTLICLVSHRLNRARKMVSQYPWLYERTGPFTWRRRGPAS